MEVWLAIIVCSLPGRSETVCSPPELLGFFSTPAMLSFAAFCVKLSSFFTFLADESRLAPNLPKSWSLIERTLLEE